MSTSKSQKYSRIPRPPNSWICFRSSSALKEILGNKLHQDSFSAKASKIWKSLSDEALSYWQRVADLKEQEHKEKYPNYRYRPRSKKADQQQQEQPTVEKGKPRRTKNTTAPKRRTKKSRSLRGVERDEACVTDDTASAIQAMELYALAASSTAAPTPFHLWHAADSSDVELASFSLPSSTAAFPPSAACSSDAQSSVDHVYTSPSSPASSTTSHSTSDDCPSLSSFSSPTTNGSLSLPASPTGSLSHGHGLLESDSAEGCAVRPSPNSFHQSSLVPVPASNVALNIKSNPIDCFLLSQAPQQHIASKNQCHISPSDEGLPTDDDTVTNVGDRRVKTDQVMTRKSYTTSPSSSFWPMFKLPSKPSDLHPSILPPNSDENLSKTLDVHAAVPHRCPEFQSRDVRVPGFEKSCLISGRSHPDATEETAWPWTPSINVNPAIEGHLLLCPSPNYDPLPQTDIAFALEISGDVYMDDIFDYPFFESEFSASSGS